LSAAGAGDRRRGESVGALLPAAMVNTLVRVAGLVPDDAVMPHGSRLSGEHAASRDRFAELTVIALVPEVRCSVCRLRSAFPA
jgi:hypothetical protein